MVEKLDKQLAILVHRGDTRLAVPIAVGAIWQLIRAAIAGTAGRAIVAMPLFIRMTAWSRCSPA
jgi:hypothetical protein